MTKQECIEQFREHWKFLAENCYASKEDFRGAKYMISSCYLCSYTDRASTTGFGHTMDCDLCPIDFGFSATKDSAPCERGLYGSWADTQSNSRILLSGRSILARKISELPLKTDKK